MNHPPTQLALLISLIGAGVSPHANATSGNVTVGAGRALPGVSCDEREAAALQEACAGAADIVWLPLPDVGDASAATERTRLVYRAPWDDWAPGEVPTDAPDRAPRSQLLALDSASADAMPAAEAVAATPPPRASREIRKTKSRARKGLAVVRAASEPLERLRRRTQPAVSTGRLAALLTRPVPVTPASAPADRLLDSLVEVLHEQPAVAAPVDVAVARALAGQAAEFARAVGPRVNAPVRIARQVESPSDAVLRDLDAMLSGRRDEVGAIPCPPAESPSDRVLTMLGEIVDVPACVEDGPAKRARKLAARAAKAQEKEALAQIAQEVARSGVDVALPLEAPVSADARPVVAEAPPASVTRPLTAAANPQRARPFGDRQVAVSDSSLDRVRGGFTVDGLNITFGIERAVYVNGVLVTTTSLNLSDLGRLTAGRGTVSFDVGSLGVVQSGAGNLVASTIVTAGNAGTIVQNTLDGQKIQNVTVINATANSLGVFRNLNLGSSLRSAVIDSLRR
ncbi:MAG TPA: hypothetical protein VNU71_21250 [Burkholderiaceae bacterium]|nr:hypothetical protein [Burkholderiaceae bacterium]